MFNYLMGTRQLLKQCTIKINNNFFVTSNNLVVLSNAPASTLAQLQTVCNAESLPTIRDLRKVLLNHAVKVGSSLKIDFNANIVHDQSIGAQNAVIPLASRFADSWRTYLHNKKTCRFGVLLEELDVLATYIGYKHNQNPNIPIGTPAHHSMSMFTSRVNRIDVVPGALFRSNRDIILSGYVSWVKDSSMEVTIHAQQEDSEDHGIVKNLLTAKFIMSTVLPDLTSNTPNVPLILHSPEEKNEFENGEHSKNLRIQRDKFYLLDTPPTEEENTIVRNLIIPTFDKLNLSQSRNELPEGHIWMSDSKTSTVMMCYPEQINLQGFIFNGYLFREAYDIAWANVRQFFKRSPVCLGVTDAIFLNPVPVNSLLHFNSEVCYTDGRFAEVVVDTEIEIIKTGKYTANNTFNFVFDTLADLPKVIPYSYSG